MWSIFRVNCLSYVLHSSFSDQNVQGKRGSKGWIHRVSWFLPGVALVGFVVVYLCSLHPSFVWLPLSVPGSLQVPNHYTPALLTPSAHLDHLNSNLLQHKSPVLLHLLCHFVLELLWQFCKSLSRNCNLFLPSGCPAVSFWTKGYVLLSHLICHFVSFQRPADRSVIFLPRSCFCFPFHFPSSPSYSVLQQ